MRALRLLRDDDGESDAGAPTSPASRLPELLPDFFLLDFLFGRVGVSLGRPSKLELLVPDDAETPSLFFTLLLLLPLASSELSRAAEESREVALDDDDFFFEELLLVFDPEAFVVDVDLSSTAAPASTSGIEVAGEFSAESEVAALSCALTPVREAASLRALGFPVDGGGGRRARFTEALGVAMASVLYFMEMAGCLPTANILQYKITAPGFR